MSIGEDLSDGALWQKLSRSLRARDAVQSIPSVNVDLGADSASMVDEYIAEAELCLNGKNYRAVILLCGVALEVLVRERLRLIQNVLHADKGVQEMTFEELIDWARRRGFLTNPTWQLAHWVRVHRNLLTHPKSYAKIVRDSRPMRELRQKTRVTILTTEGESQAQENRVQDRLALRFGLPPLASEVHRATSHLVRFLRTNLSFPGTREPLPPSLRKKPRGRRRAH